VLTRTRPVVRTIAPRGKPASGEVNTNIVLTAATHDGGYGGVDAVNLVDTSLSKISFAPFEDCVRADVPNRVLGYVHFTVGLAHYSADQCINLVRCSPHCVDGTRHE